MSIHPPSSRMAKLTVRFQNAFGALIPEADVSTLANCTTCTFSEAFSNYWTANLYLKARNGTYKRVNQIPNRYLDGKTGGMTVITRRHTTVQSRLHSSPQVPTVLPCLFIMTFNTVLRGFGCSPAMSTRGLPAV
jgi:hypothetical protein